MADITNPEAIRFVNEIVRPLSERARALYYECLAAVPDFQAVALEIPVGKDVIQDEREASGVSRLDCDDVRVITTFLGAYIDAYEAPAAGVNAMAKPCVRRFEAS